VVYHERGSIDEAVDCYLKFNLVVPLTIIAREHQVWISYNEYHNENLLSETVSTCYLECWYI